MSGFVGLYAIIDWPYRHALAIEDVADALLSGGAGVLQLRAKAAPSSLRIDLGRKLVQRAKAVGATVVMNDDVQAAVECQAQGVHLGQGDLSAMPKAFARAREQGLWVGISTHNEKQFQLAQELDLAYVALGPIYPTQSKSNPEATVGIDTLAALSPASAIPVVAIGGIDESRCRDCIEAGADMVAMISALEGPTPAVIRAKCRTFGEIFSRHFDFR